MAEQLDLTNPITYPSTVSYRVRELRLNRDEARIVVRLRGSNGESFEHFYEGQIALDLMSFLNTANLSNNSLERRILTKLAADGILPGTVSGTP